jgi:hypothetical protein
MRPFSGEAPNVSNLIHRRATCPEAELLGGVARRAVLAMLFV